MVDVNHNEHFFGMLVQATRQLAEHDPALAKLVTSLSQIRLQGGRLFMLGVGGGAANCAHAVNDFRKLCGIETYAPTDSVAELTARANDQGWDGIFTHWLQVSRLSSKDAIFVFSVGGGRLDQNVSSNITKAVTFAKACGALVLGVVGSKQGAAAKEGHAVVVVPTVDERLVTPITESLQIAVLHYLVSHPLLQLNPTKW